MPSKSRRPARPTSKKTPHRGATGARAAATLARRAAARKAPKRAARKAAKRTAKKTARRASKVPKKAAKKTVKTPAKKAGKRAAPAKGKKAARAPGKAVVQFTEAPRAERPLRIALFGASGRIGSRIAEEAVRRGHHVTALVRNPQEMTGGHPNLRAVRGDVTDPVQVEVAARSHDVVASAIAPPANELRVLTDAAKSLLTAARATGKRVVAVGGAGSLEVAPGLQLVDSPRFPAEARPVALAHRDALKVFQAERAAPWTVLSPAAMIEPGERTGSFRWGTDQLIATKAGDSRISMEDYAVAFVDELESAKNPGKRITVGY